MGIPYLTIDGSIDLCDLREADLSASRIADGLARINRFNGRTPVPWSVASHSVLVSHLCPQGLEGWGLLHDAHEAFLGDIATPSVDFIDRFDGLPQPRAVSDALMRAKHAMDQRIAAAWSWSYDGALEPLFRADMIALDAEMFWFFGESPQTVGPEYEDAFDRAVSHIHELPKDTAWRDARDVWLARARHLAGLGQLRTPAEGLDPARMVRPENSREIST